MALAVALAQFAAVAVADVAGEGVAALAAVELRQEQGSSTGEAQPAGAVDLPGLPTSAGVARPRAPSPAERLGGGPGRARWVPPGEWPRSASAW